MSPNNQQHQEELAADRRAKPRGRWHGGKPVNCDLCQNPLQSEFIDGRTALGPWAIMCCVCHSMFGFGLGTRNGQKYNRETLEKVGG